MVVRLSFALLSIGLLALGHWGEKTVRFLFGPPLPWPEVSWEVWLSLLTGIPLAGWHLRNLLKLKSLTVEPSNMQPKDQRERMLEFLRRYERIIALAILAPVVFTAVAIILVVLTAIFLVVVFILILLWVASTVKPVR